MHKLILLFLLLSFTACSSQKKVSIASTQSILSTDTYKEDGVEIYTSLAGVSKNMEAKLEEKGIKRIVLVNGGYLDKGMDYRVRKQEIRDYIRKRVQDENSNAMIVLDFEGKKMIELNKTTDQNVIDKIIEFYIKILTIVKEERPNATVGYYGYPFRDYWHRNDAWRAKNDRLMPLFEKVDAIFPSVYDFYVDNVDVKMESDIAYVKDNVEESLRLASVYDKKVYPFVWHRYHDSNKNVAKQFIDPTEFQNHIAAIVEASYNGTYADGIVWWSSERYYYNVSPRGVANKRNADADFNKFADENSLKYIDILIEGIKQGKRENLQK